ncbi:early nodulin-like protein 1 [Phtheirospermum japonicum]|uniref:Early nodulin-like protein 1 n=1 Tax=Phtheirospermum japonicum TaxID=374723 RepID=A0A830CK92_9LAMI|nr:early nodulin-like protein 1 [Phtheirospermum japonicum]
MSLCFATLFLLIITSSAEEFKVGGDEGWRQPAANETEMYVRWAATAKFHVGDSLRFEYKKDTVVVVDKWGYYHCNSSHAVTVFKNGNTVINMERPGPVFFISANPDHCRSGQRLTVEVMSPHQISQDASPAPSPFSGAASYFVAPEIVFCSVVLIVVSINM